MAADSSSPEEAAIAAGRARALMDKHQLDEYDITEKAAELFGEVPATRFFAGVPAHLGNLAIAVARYNDCRADFELGIVDFKKKAGDPKMVGRRIVFQGYASDAKLATDMFVMLSDTVDRLCKEYLAPMGFTKYPVRIGSRFKLGASITIKERLEAMAEARQALVTSSGTALVVVKAAAVTERFGEAKYGEKKRNLADADEVMALAMGKEQGRHVQIIPQVED
jgi:hypothetical protein